MDIIRLNPKTADHDLGLSNRPFRAKKRKRRLFWGLMGIVVLFSSIFFLSSILAVKFYTTSKKIIDPAAAPSSLISSFEQLTAQGTLLSSQNDRINILLVGLAGENHPGENLTDSIMVASIDTKGYNSALLSIPRDLYVRIPETRISTKINALYPYGLDQYLDETKGLEVLRSAIEEITNLKINYYVAVDFEGFEQIIDKLGGINVVVPQDMKDKRYPGPNYSYETFEISHGLQTLSGAVALKYARTRHDEQGDFGRAYRQQQILEAVRNKAFSIKTLLNIPSLLDILDALGEHVKTDIGLSEIEPFLELVKKVDTHTTVNEVLDSQSPQSLLAVSHVSLGGIRAFVLVPRAGNWDDIHERAENVFNLETARRKSDAIKDEEAQVGIVNYSGSKNAGEQLRKNLASAGFQAKTIHNPSQKAKSTADFSAIVDRSDGRAPFSIDELKMRTGFKVMVNEEASDDLICETDFCIILGRDALDWLDWEEDSIEDLEKGYDSQEIDEKAYIELLKKGSTKSFVK